jgi:hypothetical protein
MVGRWTGLVGTGMDIFVQAGQPAAGRGAYLSYPNPGYCSEISERKRKRDEGPSVCDSRCRAASLAGGSARSRSRRRGSAVCGAGFCFRAGGWPQAGRRRGDGSRGQETRGGRRPRGLSACWLPCGRWAGGQLVVGWLWFLVSGWQEAGKPAICLGGIARLFDVSGMRVHRTLVRRTPVRMGVALVGGGCCSCGGCTPPVGVCSGPFLHRWGCCSCGGCTPPVGVCSGPFLHRWGCCSCGGCAGHGTGVRLPIEQAFDRTSVLYRTDVR